MDDLPPMRPVDNVGQNPPKAAPFWVIALWFVTIVAAGAAVPVLPAPSAAAAIVGSAMVAIGVAAAAAGTARVHRENDGQRIPWWGPPPRRPRKLDLLQGTGLPLVAFGATLLGRCVETLPSLVVPLVAVALVTVTASLAQALHNRRVEAT
ncbi:hypothetical protein ERC79_08140 [Rhodococcus sp. ABRD24]|uniref:hypothetical protein n=1 Tax=Rhodococcus sp. ABRD24 TaxID=2507582 RepID=UPI0010405388|nr:hypothetical protein [Rhodococcus sp. ABRD24]QBJ95943.1 hypothetical protein ERC79_08140 [Rhodococcus sp. ABRD24]